MGMKREEKMKESKATFKTSQQKWNNKKKKGNLGLLGSESGSLASSHQNASHSSPTDLLQSHFE